VTGRAAAWSISGTIYVLISGTRIDSSVVKPESANRSPQLTSLAA
jgi:hypothetical protein